MKKNTLLLLICQIIYPILGMQEDNNLKLTTVDTFKVSQANDGSMVFELDDYSSETSTANSSSVYSLPKGFEFVQSERNEELRKAKGSLLSSLVLAGKVKTKQDKEAKEASLSYHKLLHLDTQTYINQNISQPLTTVDKKLTHLVQQMTQPVDFSAQINILSQQQRRNAKIMFGVLVLGAANIGLEITNLIYSSK